MPVSGLSYAIEEAPEAVKAVNTARISGTPGRAKPASDGDQRCRSKCQSCAQSASQSKPANAHASQPMLRASISSSW